MTVFDPAILEHCTPRQREVLEAVLATGSMNEAARNLNVDNRYPSKVLKIAMDKHAAAVKLNIPMASPLPEADIPTDEIIDHMTRRFEKRHAHTTAKRWRTFHIPNDGPYALMFFGDPHVDDNGCNWTLLRAHCELARQTEALYAINIGDTTNNWTGRLARLWAEQDTSSATARKLAQWLLGESGVPWFLWLHGNHDLWGGPVGREWFGAVKPHFVEMEDWQAKVTLRSPNGYELRLWAAHNFKGNSIWNPMHGLLRAAQMQDWAHLYVAGHHHNSGLMQMEHEHRAFMYSVARVRGYKFLDHYADLHGFGHFESGAAMVAVVDPAAKGCEAVKCYMDPFEGAEYLAYKRSKFEA